MATSASPAAIFQASSMERLVPSSVIVAAPAAPGSGRDGPYFIGLNGKAWQSLQITRLSLCSAWQAVQDMFSP